MENTIIFRDRQELQAADFNDFQRYTRESVDGYRLDATGAGNYFTGLNVAKTSSSTVSVDVGRLYQNGQAFNLSEHQEISLFQIMPQVAQKIVAIVAWGAQIEDNVQPRDFLIDLTNGTTQPQAVAMTTKRIVTLDKVVGVESTDPQKPTIAPGLTVLAYLLMDTAGVVVVDMNVDKFLPNASNIQKRVAVLETWQSLADPRISSIATDLTALSVKTESKAEKESLIMMSLDIARLKSKLNLPASYAAYQTNGFGNTDLTDSTFDATQYRIENGLTFPFEAKAEGSLAPFNPYDASIKQHADGLVLPKYNEVTRLKTEGFSGEVSCSQYQVQQRELRYYRPSYWYYRYGYHYNYYGNWYNTWYWNYYSYNYIWRHYYGFYNSYPDYYYTLGDERRNYSGTIIAQTFLVQSAMWLTSVDLFFTRIGSTGDVTIAIVETDKGKPVLDNTLTSVTLTVDRLKRYPSETNIAFPVVMLDAGKRYALVVITQGNHYIAVVSGNNYTQGTLFYGNDGDYMMGDLGKDMMFNINAAQFSKNRIELMLQSISLGGGISDLSISAPQVVPKGTELSYEIQVNGIWRPIGNKDMYLSGKPSIVPIRAVFNGTSDMMPALKITESAIMATRPSLGFTHQSKTRTLGAGTNNIQVKVLVSQFDSTKHTLACALLVGASTLTPATTLVKAEPDGVGIMHTFTFTGTAINNYKIKLTGGCNNTAAPFVVCDCTDIAI